ncbi:MAG TPA: UDP-N-acetylglucosamine 2-epimerase (non-hydrolyzing) [Pyrinomonadaceae bacterium]|nr:UDP-N-acetylglucosamine 2-epimerase (non-hydrolyzing) [Pyrinomonadaceae bacterium]
MLKVLSVFGTRPEAIKMSPLVRAMAARPKEIASKVCVTAQHRQMLDEMLNLFAITPDFDLDVMEEGQSPTRVAAAVLSRLEPVLLAEKPDWVLVQGDTTTTAAAAFAAFHAGAKVGHVEAGLRTGDRRQPFPEEVNRRVAGLVADMHFAPTERARRDLLAEGVPGESVLVTGNTAVDALAWALRQEPPAELTGLLRGMGVPDGPPSRRTLTQEAASPPNDGGPKLILATAHRRENFGRPLEAVCEALRAVAARYRGNVQIIYPVHSNPRVSETVRRLLGATPNITLTPPLGYLPMIHLMGRCHLILTDSGGLLEEAPSLGKPVLILRRVTERPEALEAGWARVVGVESGAIFSEVVRLLDDHAALRAMTPSGNPFGDGRASERIVRALLGSQGAAADATAVC